MSTPYRGRWIFLWPVYLMVAFCVVAVRSVFPFIKMSCFQALLLLPVGFASFSLFTAILMRQADFREGSKLLLGRRGVIVRRMILLGGCAFAAWLYLMGIQSIPRNLLAALSLILFAVLILVPLLPAHRHANKNGRAGALARLESALDMLLEKLFGKAYLLPAPRFIGEGNSAVNLAALVLFLTEIAGAFLPFGDASVLAAFAGLCAPIALGALLSWTTMHWNVLIRGTAAILPSIAVVFVLSAGCVIGLLSPQGQDALRILASSPVDRWVFFALVLVFMVVCVVSFYASLFVADLKHKITADCSEWTIKKSQLIVPHLVIGYAVLFMLFAAIQANAPVSNGLMPWWIGGLSLFSIASLLAIALMNGPRGILYKLWTFFPKLFFNESHDAIAKNRLRDASRAMVVLGATFVGWIVFMFLMTIDSGEICSSLHTPCVLISAAILWIGVFGVLQIVTNSAKHGLVLIPLLLFMVVCFSPWRNNHAVRMIPLVNNQRVTVKALFAAFQNNLGDTVASNHPIIVAAEGGGMRSAYWTARLLAAMQDRYPEFSRRLFAVSSVSGGSLGSNVFVALLKSGSSTACTTLVDSVLKQDFLSPVMGKLLFPEVVQCFLPCNIAPFDTLADRARALEGSWERAFAHSGANSALLSQGFLATNGGNVLPALFLNTTWSETGQRGVLGSARLCGPSVALDIFDTIGAQRDVSWSTAVSLSARFPVISPGGQLSGAGGLWGHCIDGGYHDNTGIQTVMEILRCLPPEARPGILVISNNFIDTASRKPIRWYNEAQDIIVGFFKAPSARAVSDMKMLKTCMPGADVFEANMPLDQKAVPLGWYLSPPARDSVKACVRRTLADSLSTSSVASLMKKQK